MSLHSSKPAWLILCLFFFFFNDTATTEIYTLSLHDALPILSIVAALTGWISKFSFCASARKSASRIVASKAAVSADLRSAASSGGAANGRAMAWLSNNSLMICSCSGLLTRSVASGTAAISGCFLSADCTMILTEWPVSHSACRVLIVLHDSPHRPSTSARSMARTASLVPGYPLTSCALAPNRFLYSEAQISGSASAPRPPSFDGLLRKSLQVLIGEEFQVTHVVSSSVMLPSQVNFRLSNSAWRSGAIPMLRENVPNTEPSFGATEKM